MPTRQRLVFAVAAVAMALVSGRVTAGVKPWSPARQQAPPPTAATAPTAAEPARAGPSDPIELEAFIDGVVATQLTVHDVAGATVSVVRDGAVMLAKGYGMADVERRERVDSTLTLFRIGSISKLFVWTAVMQLVERGELDLDRDVNGYLRGFQIPATYDQPVTMAHLMTHSAGFEDHVIGLFGRDESTLAPLAELLGREMPRRVRPPGEVSSYSNHGTGIAAAVVEAVTGQPFVEYVETQITGPLGMTRTTFRQPLPADLLADMSRGYSYEAQVFVEKDFEYVPLAPVGAASSTAVDMARFMIAWLQRGRLGDARILQETTADRTLRELFRQAPEVNPMAHGFLDVSHDGQWVVGHGGDTLWFHSMLALFPDHDLGVFVSFNSAGGGAATLEFEQAFANRYFAPRDPPALEPAADSRATAQRFVGSYRANRYSHSTLAKLTAIDAVEVTVAEDGALLTSATGNRRWINVSPLAFREHDGTGTLAFREDERGNITYMFLGPVQILAFERLRGWESPPLQMFMLLFSNGIFLITVLAWPTAAVLRRKHGYKVPREKRLPRPARLVAWCACALMLGFWATFALTMSQATRVIFGVPESLRTVMTLPLIAALLAAAALILCGLAWRRGRGSLWVRLYYTIVCFAFAVAFFQLNYWNLLGFRF